MATLSDLRPFARSSVNPPPRPPKRTASHCCTRRPFQLRFSIAAEESSSISSSKLSAGDDGRTSHPPADCVIIGAGISGLAIAHALTAKHSDVARNVIVTEAANRVGGNISTVERGGYLWEEGPNIFQPSDSMLALAVDNGLKGDIVLGDAKVPRFVLWGGKLRPLPSKPTDLPFFDLMSFSGKLRAGLGACGIRPPPPATGS